MEFVGKPLTGAMLVNMHWKCIENCTRVKAAVAYASNDNIDLFRDCFSKSKPLEFYGRYDGSCAIEPLVLRWFLDRKSPSIACRMVPKYLHAKVIWWEGEGVYIGSANLTNRAWNKNYEAGVFMSDPEMRHAGVDDELETFFDRLRQKSRPLTEEMYESQKKLHEARRKVSGELEKIQATFDEKDDWVRGAVNPIEVSNAPADSRRFDRFTKEWNATLQCMRDVAARVSAPSVRPSWIDETVPPGVQADQFLHAYYYRKVREGNRHPYEEAHERNRKDPEAALSELLIWWRHGDFDITHEQTTIYQWARILRENFAKDRVLSLSEEEWVAAASCVHAIRDHAAKMENQLLGLPSSPQDLEVKTAMFCRWLWGQRSEGGHTCVELVNHVVWGPGEITKRLWEAVHDPKWKFRHVAISTLGEIVGWANPDKYPPRNMRTSKSLRALGYDVEVAL